MLQCLRDARWVYVEYDREMNAVNGKGAYAWHGLAQVATALYQVKMTRLENEIYLREVNDALLGPRGGE
jgi:hypothetical protein